MSVSTLDSLRTGNDAPAGSERLELDTNALEAAKRSLEKGAVTPSYGPWREDIIRLLNDALATEIVCTLRYKRHHFTAKGLASPKIAEEFLVHANEETAHADMIAERIVRLDADEEVGRDESRALVQQLVERVLAVGARLAPEHLAGVGRHRRAVPAHALAVGLHGQLLEVGGETV